VTSLLDEISPEFIRSEVFTLTLSEPLVAAKAFTAVLIDVNYDGADEFGGVMNPLELTIDSPSPDLFVRDIFGDVAGGISQREPPSQVAFTPKEGGRFRITLREVGHNKLYGTLQVDVLGTINDPSVAQGQDS
jgi:hypothetical protein